MEDQGKWAQAEYCYKLQVPRSSCFWWWLKIRDSLKISKATAALTKLMPIWRDNNIISRIKDEADALPCHFDISVCLWIVNLDSSVSETTQAFELSYWTFRTKTILPMRRFVERLRQPLQNMMNSGPWSRNGNLRWFGHASRSTGLAKTNLQDTIKSKRRRGRLSQRKKWQENIKE